jgi:PiT family inorganic phosphate transporter
LGVYLIRKIQFKSSDNQDFAFANVEKIFGAMMIFTAAAMAFAHGSNDVANAVGPMAAVINIAQTGSIESSSVLPAWVLLVGGIGIVIGLATYGYKVIATVGKKITELTPTRGFAANIAAGITIVLASFTGIPISTTQTLVGAILGVGLARGIASIDLRVVGNIFMSWMVTLPAGAILSILFFFMLKGMFT